MTFARLCLLTTFVCALPVTAVAQTAATPSPAPAQPPMTQPVTVVDPNMDALTPPTPSSGVRPRWSEFPLTPKNVPSLADFAGRVHREETDSTVLDTIGRSIVWEIYQPDAIAAAANAAMDPSKMVPVDAEMTPAQTEALAKSLRDQDVPPPLAQ